MYRMTLYTGTSSFRQLKTLPKLNTNKLNEYVKKKIVLKHNRSVPYLKSDQGGCMIKNVEFGKSPYGLNIVKLNIIKLINH